MLTKIFLTPVSEPYSEGLRDLFALFLSQRFVEVDGVLAFSTTGFVMMRIPVRASQADTAINLLNECLPH